MQWGTDVKTNLQFWAEKGIWTIKDIINEDGNGWKPFAALTELRRSVTSPQMYHMIKLSSPWQPQLIIPSHGGLWIASKEDDGKIHRVYHINKANHVETTAYNKLPTEQLLLLDNNCALPEGQFSEVRIVRCGGSKRKIIDYNPQELDDPEHTLWMWGEDWICNLEWDPKEWNWRRVGALADTNVLNYCTKRGYRAALQQNNHKMRVDIELEEAGYNNKDRAKFFNRIWHPYLPRKVAAMQWMILTEGLPVEAWRERLGLPNNCQLCPAQHKDATTRLPRMFRNPANMGALPPNETDSWATAQLQFMERDKSRDHDRPSWSEHRGNSTLGCSCGLQSHPGNSLGHP